MRNLNVNCVTVPTADIAINHNEAAVRLKVKRDFKDASVDECKNELESVINYRFAYVKTPVKLFPDGFCDIGFGKIQSRDLCRALDGCNEAFIMGATVGIAVDRLIAKYALISPAKHFITDALASAAAESICEYVDDFLRGTGKKPMRYSPGYGDLSLGVQRDVLKMIDAENTLGIVLNSSLLMTPMKSVTAVMGVKNDNRAD